MSALEAPTEILLVAFFKDAARVESAVESLWRRGFDSDRLSLLARKPRRSADEAGLRTPDWRRQRAVSPHLWFGLQRSALVRLPHIGQVVALGAIAEELTDGPASRRGVDRLPRALRRLGLPEDEAETVERAVGGRQVFLAARVSRAEAHDWAALLKVAGAISITARLRLEPWPRVPHRRKARRASRPRSRRGHASIVSGAGSSIPSR
jgi:hypothetical protein